MTGVLQYHIIISYVLIKYTTQWLTNEVMDCSLSIEHPKRLLSCCFLWLINVSTWDCFCVLSRLRTCKRAPSSAAKVSLSLSCKTYPTMERHLQTRYRITHVHKGSHAEEVEMTRVSHKECASLIKIDTVLIRLTQQDRAFIDVSETQIQILISTMSVSNGSNLYSHASFNVLKAKEFEWCVCYVRYASAIWKIDQDEDTLSMCACIKFGKKRDIEVIFSCLYPCLWALSLVICFWTCSTKTIPIRSPKKPSGKWIFHT